MQITIKELDSNLVNVVERASTHEPATAALFDVMYVCGVRANEATTPAMWEMQSDQIITLKPLKYNDIRIFKVSEMPESYITFLMNYKSWQYLPNYSRLNRLFKKFSKYNNIYIGNKKSTCHLFRHNYVKKLIAQNLSHEDIQKKLGERQMKSALSYINSTFSTTAAK